MPVLPRSFACTPARSALVGAVLAATLLAACAPLPPAGNAAAADPPPAATSGPVRVAFSDPSTFDESRESPHETARTRNAWLEELQKHIVRQAGSRLAPGQQLDVTITDVRRAGSFEPWRGPRADDVRIVRDIYPPRIDLDMTLRAADGSVLRSGHRTLRDMMFLSRTNLYSTDPLRYEKALLDDWLAEELRAPARG